MTNPLLWCGLSSRFIHHLFLVQRFASDITAMSDEKHTVWFCMKILLSEVKPGYHPYNVSVSHKQIYIVLSCSCLQCLTLLVGRPAQHPACKNWAMRCWHGYLSGARSNWFAYGPADKIKIGLTFLFLIPAFPGCPGKEVVKRLPVCLSLVGLV